ncbi:MAG: hypothetical protein U5M50_10475 [Sphingobium sp.]|nr:hypothetical protein [Sphingobium sp.]
MARGGTRKIGGAKTGRKGREASSLSEANRLAWAQRHPAKAAAERRLRKAQATAQDRWRHKANGTVETHAHAARTRQGAIARLHQSGAIDDEQLAAAASLTWVYDRIARDVTVRTASMETRVDRSPHGKATREALWVMEMELAYSRWRVAMGAQAGAVLDVIVHDRGLVDVATAAAMGPPRLRRMVAGALTLWSSIWAETYVDEWDALWVERRIG